MICYETTIIYLISVSDEPNGYEKHLIYRQDKQGVAFYHELSI